MQKLRIAAIDDEPLLLDWLGGQLNQMPDIELVAMYDSFSKMMKSLPDYFLDAVFIDMEMPDRHGLEVAEWVRELPGKPEVIFLTAHPQFALDAFRVQASHYLLKPVSVDELTRSLKLVRSRRKSISGIRSGFNTMFPPQQDQIRWRVFGDSGLWLKNAIKPIHWPTAKSEEVFFYLMLNSYRVTNKWVLLDQMFEPPYDEKTINSLHKTISRIKKTLTDHHIQFELSKESGGYLLRIQDIWSESDAIDSWYKTCQLSDDELSRDIRKAILNYLQVEWTDPMEAKDWSWLQAIRQELDIKREYIIQSFMRMKK